MTSSLSPDQHEACGRRLLVLEGWARKSWRELAAVYGSESLVGRAAEAASGALANLRDACQHQARIDHPHDPEVAAHYQPPPRPPGSS